MSVLAIDWGSKHVGLAISYSGVYAKELTVLSNKPILFDELKKLIAEHQVSTIVVGLPKNNDGSEAVIAHNVRSFATKLKRQFKLPVMFENEHLTSKEAVRLLEGVVDPADPRIDAASAKLILEQYLADRII
ncbi:MAG: Holliday junction resolvase RuvX [Patescibacteria group bacterium]